MVDYRASRDPIGGEKVKGGAGRLVGIVAVFVLLLASLLFVSGFWNPRATNAALPPVAQSAAAIPKDNVAGTMKLPVDLPNAR